MGYVLPITGGSGSGSGGAGACNVVNNIYCGEGDGTGTGGGDTKDPSGTVSIDGALEYNFDLTSADHVSTGVYDVTTVPIFEVVAGKTQCAIKVSPQGVLQALITALFSEFKGLSSVTFSQDDINIFYDPVLNELYTIDTFHSTVASVSYDRLAILNPDTRGWSYINFIGEDLQAVHTADANPLLFDPINHKTYVLGVNTHIGTLIFDMIGRQKVFDTWADIAHSQSDKYYVLAVNPNNSTCLIVGDSHILRWHTTIGGIPVVPAVANAAVSSGYDTGGMIPVVDINNNYWIYKNTGGANVFWTRVFLAGSVLTFEDISVTTDQVSNPAPTPTRINPNTNCFCYLSSNHDYLMQFNCTTKVASRINASSYPALTGPNRHLTLRGVTSLEWSSDYSKLIAIRGGSGGSQEDVLLVNPVDGLVDAGFIIPDSYSRNLASGNMAVSVARLWNISSERIIEVDFSGGEDFGQVSTSHVTYEATWLSANKCRVEFKDTLTGARVDSAFHIAFASPGTAAGGGGTPSTGEPVHQLIHPFAYSDSTPALIGQVASGKQILSTQIFITTAFNGTGAALSVGITGTPADLMATTENNPAAIGEYSVYQSKVYGAATNIYLTIVPGAGASAGAGFVVIEYQP